MAGTPPRRAGRAGSLAPWHASVKLRCAIRRLCAVIGDTDRGAAPRGSPCRSGPAWTTSSSAPRVSSTGPRMPGPEGRMLPLLQVVGQDASVISRSGFRPGRCAPVFGSRRARPASPAEHHLRGARSVPRRGSRDPGRHGAAAAGLIGSAETPRRRRSGRVASTSPGRGRRRDGDRLTASRRRSGRRRSNTRLRS